MATATLNHNHIQEALTGERGETEAQAEKLYNILAEGWGFPETPIEQGRTGVDVSARIARHGDDYGKYLEENYGTRHPFMAAAVAGETYDPGEMDEKETIPDVDRMTGATPEDTKATIDASTVQDATPVIVDPMIIDVQRQRAPVLDRIPVQSQQGFQAKYNIISARNEPIAYADQNEVLDLSDNDYGDFSIEPDSEDMRIYVDQVNVSDFAQRATDSLGFMDLEQTTLGQRTIEWALTKAAAYFYGDPSAGAAGLGYSSLGTDRVFPGLTQLAASKGNDFDRTTVDTTAGDFPVLEDLKSIVTWVVQNTGLTYADAEIFVSPTLFDMIENEANPVVRLESFSEGVNFGARQLSIKGVPVTECPNISPNFELPWDGSPEGPGNAFIVDRRAVQFRALAPLFMLPLGRVGLADRTALAEYGTLIDKSQGEHTFWLEYDVGTSGFDPSAA